MIPVLQVYKNFSVEKNLALKIKSFKKLKFYGINIENFETLIECNKNGNKQNMTFFHNHFAIKKWLKKYETLKN